MPTPETILQQCGRLAVYLELDRFPMVDIGLIASRYIAELDLPRAYLILPMTQNSSLITALCYTIVMLCNMFAGVLFLQTPVLACGVPCEII